MRPMVDTSDMICLAGDVDLRVFVSDCYALSHPHGLGSLHYQPGPLPAEAMPEFGGNDPIVVAVDYLLGRCVKMCVYRHKHRLWIRDRWQRHTDSELVALCARHAAERAHYQNLLADPDMVWLANTADLSPVGPTPA